MAAVTHPPVRRVEDEVSLRELVLLIHRRRWLLLACLLLGGIAGIGLLSIVRPVYVASTFLLIDPERRGGTAATVASVNDTLDNGALDSQVEILASRSLAQATIDALDLAHDPDFLAPIGATTDLMSHLLPASLAGAPELDPASDPVGRFLDNLVVRRSGKSHVIAISYRSHQPAQAATVANKVAELYMAAQQARKREAARQQSGWLAERLAELKRDYEGAERDLAAYRHGHEADSLAPDGGEEMARLAAELVLASADRSAREAGLARVRQQVASGTRPDAEGEQGSSPLLAALSTERIDLLKREAELGALYGARHPKIQALRAERDKLDGRLAQERQGLVRTAENVVEQARARETMLGSKLAELKDQAARREAMLQRAGELASEVDVRRRAFEAYLARANAEDRPAETLVADARVISEAVPAPDPTFPDAKLVLSLALSSGLLVGFVAVYVAESGEPRFRAPADLEATLGVPALAAIPKLQPARLAGLSPQDYVLERPRSRYAEALRTLLAGLLRPPGATGQPPRVVLVTSSLPREGKSTLVASLARIAAGEGLRVIVIDADLRKPRLHELFGFPAGPGLVEVLRREVTLAEALVKDERAPLRVLPGSRRLTQPTRLLGPEGLGTLLAALKRNFDLVLVDSAPLAAVADAKLLAGLVDAVLFAVRYDDTRRDFARTCMKGLTEAGAPVAGAVLTQLDLKDAARRLAGRAGKDAARLGDYYVD